MYTCGPTVYDVAHIGNFRAFLTYDIVKRVLAYLGYKNIVHVCNLTDVDDKIIVKCNEQQISLPELTTKYSELFLQDLQALHIVPATHYPKATQHITDMMDIIVELRDKGLAYELSDSWYFRTQQQPTYGTQLVQLNYEEMEQQDSDETDNDNAQKEHFADFCLWKAYKEGIDRKEDAAWEDKERGIALGRPGWHLECSAMARHFFGNDQTIDLHGGGVDLKFPHHENEIAQSEGVMNSYNNGKINGQYQPFCNCWFHNGFVNIGAENEKMSKSLGNFLSLQTACPTPMDVRAYRYLVVSSQYRNPLSFTEQAMKASKNAIKRMDKIKAQLEETLSSKDVTMASGLSEIADTLVPSILDNFEAAICDDLSMPRAAAQLFALVKAAENEYKRVAKQKDDDESLDIKGLQAILNAMNQMDQVFGIFYTVPPREGESDSSDNTSGSEVPVEVMELVSQRTQAKEVKDWELADSLRARITELGYTVKDVKGGEPIVSPVE